jgi:CRP-like cAMP-binding protein
MEGVHIFQYETNTQHIAAGEALFHEGTPSHYLYVVIAGQVELSYAGVPLTIIEPGGITGIAFIGSRPHITTAVALTDCTLALIDEKRWRFLVQQTPNFSNQVMAILVEHLRVFVEQLSRSRAQPHATLGA